MDDSTRLQGNHSLVCLVQWLLIWVWTFGVICLTIDLLFRMFTNHKIRHQSTRKVDCQPGEWTLNLFHRICVDMYELTFSLDNTWELHFLFFYLFIYLFFAWRKICMTWWESQKTSTCFKALISTPWSPQSPFCRVGVTSKSRTSIAIYFGKVLGRFPAALPLR